MSRLDFTFRTALVAMTLSASLIIVRAGDAIVFSNDKTKATPSPVPSDGKRGPTVVEKIRPSALDVDPNRGAWPQPLPSQSGSGRRTREDRKRQAELDEKRNWLLLRPGELQEEEANKENSFGVRDHDKWSEKVDANGRRDFTFRGLGEGKHGADAKIASPSAGQNPAAKGEGDLNQPAEMPEPSAASPTKKPGLSAHTAQELDFRGFFPGDESKAKESAAKTGLVNGKEDETTALMREFIGNPSSARSREQHERMDKFNQMLRSPPTSLALPGSGNSGVSEATRPVMAAPPAADSATRFGGSPMQFPSSGARLDSAPGLRSQAGSAGWNDPNPLRGTAPNRPGPSGNNPWDSNPQQQINKPSVSRPLVIEPPVRRL